MICTQKESWHSKELKEITKRIFVASSVGRKAIWQSSVEIKSSVLSARKMGTKHLNVEVPVGWQESVAQRNVKGK